MDSLAGIIDLLVGNSSLLAINGILLAESSSLLAVNGIFSENMVVYMLKAFPHKKSPAAKTAGDFVLMIKLIAPELSMLHG
ncbi:hypothetical protein ACSFXN_14290 [Planococcus sp. 1R117A]|uniref:hypothetical protein n=1 Tax=Planococcus sp. 1R117A TaxID=3447020 RepID=UPI003EDC3185